MLRSGNAGVTIGLVANTTYALALNGGLCSGGNISSIYCCLVNIMIYLVCLKRR